VNNSEKFFKIFKNHSIKRKNYSNEISSMSRCSPGIPQIFDRTINKTRNPISSLKDLQTLDRKFICKGSVWEVLGFNMVKERILFLFNDILIIAKDKGVKFEVKSILDISQMYIKECRNLDVSDLFEGTPAMNKALRKFEVNPSEGISYLIQKEILTSAPPVIAQFLFRTKDLNKKQIGKFLGISANYDILLEYVRLFDFTDMRLDEAIRYFLGAFRMPGDTNVIDLVLGIFAARYYECNEDSIPSADLSLKLLLALLSLNADLYNDPNPDSIISVGDFIAAFHEDKDGCKIPSKTLGEMYYSIRNERLGVASDRIQDLIPIKVSFIPYRITKGEISESITISIPNTDPNFKIKIFASKGLKCTPRELNFSKSNQVTFNLFGASYGLKYIAFVKSGSSAFHYMQQSLPHGKCLIVEPTFMKHVFQIKSKFRDEDTGRKISYMFSVANEEQNLSWQDQIRAVADSLENNELCDLGTSDLSFVSDFEFSSRVRMIP
jgi:hypothetical protein